MGEGGGGSEEGSEYPEKTSDDELQKCHTLDLHPESSSPNPYSNPFSRVSGRLGKQTCKSLRQASPQIQTLGK